MSILAKRLTNQASFVKALGCALAAGLIVLSLCGCAAEQPKKPQTLKGFFSQPRPE